MRCPNCGRTGYKEARQCPKYDGEPVCIDCCRECDFYNSDSMNCQWHSYNRGREYEHEKECLMQKARALKKESEKMWTSGKKGAALKKEEEYRLAWEQIKAL